jgi:hypothetical protein
MTSGMMEALEAGGMDAAYSSARDVSMNSRFGDPDYVPNTQYMELDQAAYRKKDFPLPYAGKLIKILYGGLYRLPAIPDLQYNIVMMTRQQEEIRNSLLAFFGTDQALHNIGGDLKYTFNHVEGVMRDRKSVNSFTVLKVADVVKNPLQHFTLLSSKGWPIDPEKAAQIIDGKKLRFST